MRGAWFFGITAVWMYSEHELSARRIGQEPPKVQEDVVHDGRTLYEVSYPLEA